jgi:hypothetical protein
MILNASYSVGARFFPGVKRSESNVNHPPPSSGQINPLNPELNPIC